MVHLRVAACSLCCMVLPMSADAGDTSLRDRAAKSLKKAVGFFRREVATEGGYLWRYSADLARREGEGAASATTVWVQPPGTPSVGAAYLEAYEATGDRYYLEAARETAYCLVRGQLRSGGWDYRIEFDPTRPAGPDARTAAGLGSTVRCRYASGLGAEVRAAGRHRR